MNPKVSILMPAFNVEPYIEEAIDSILIQTFEDFEFIILDDCSTDGTWQKILNKAKEDTRIVPEKNEVNSGIALTLNRALAISKGEYIVRMDSDDISLPDRIETLLSEMDKRGLDIMGSSTITINENGAEIGGYKPLVEHIDIVNTVQYASPILHIWICKKELYLKIGEYRNPPVEDYDFLLRCISNGAKLGNSPRQLYKVRMRGGNTVDLYGFKQLRAFEVVYKNFVLGNNEKINCGKRFDIISEFLYQWSHKVMMLGSGLLKEGKRIQAGAMFVISAIISPYQLRYFWRRISLYIYCRKIRNDKK